MPVLNRVFLVGNLTRDPEGLRRTPTGMAVMYLRLALNTRVRAPGGGVQEERCFVDVSVWGRDAETMVRTLHRGCMVLVVGRLWSEDSGSDSGRKGRLSVVAERIEPLGEPGRHARADDKPGLEGRPSIGGIGGR